MKEEDLYSLILSVLTEEASEEESRQLQEWLAESERNREEFEQIKHLYHTFRQSREAETYPYDTERAWQRVCQQTVAKSKKRRLNKPLRRWLSYAAMIALICIAATYTWQKQETPRPINGKFQQPTLMLGNGEAIALKQDSFSRTHGNIMIHNNTQKDQLCYKSQNQQPAPSKGADQNRLIIPKGNTYELTLADGTHIWLNAESELIFPTSFNNGTREVQLKGEAFFEVAKDPDRPFIVKTDQIDIKVLGTKFNVSAYESEATIQVTLTEGAVAVQTGQGQEFQVKPSEQWSYNRGNGQSDIQTVETGLYTSWTQGKYLFKNATLDEMLTKLNHWYDFTVEYENEQLKYKRFSCTIDRSISLPQLLELLSFTSDVKLEKRGEKITINVEPKKKEVE